MALVDLQKQSKRIFYYFSKLLFACSEITKYAITLVISYAATSFLSIKYFPFLFGSILGNSENEIISVCFYCLLVLYLSSDFSKINFESFNIKK